MVLVSGILLADSNTTNVKVKHEVFGYQERWAEYIQIQPMLRLNSYISFSFLGVAPIQIQPMLRLNPHFPVLI